MRNFAETIPLTLLEFSSLAFEFSLMSSRPSLCELLRRDRSIFVECTEVH